MNIDDNIRYALEHTELVRPPQQKLATFGSSTIDYYVVTELAGNISVVRDGKVIAERPKIITPSYLINAEGFSEQAKRSIGAMVREHPDEPGVFYRYKNMPGEMNIISEPIRGVINKLNTRIDEQHNPLGTIIKGVEELWDVSLLMFIYELTRSSFHSNIAEFHRKGSLAIDSSGLPRDARNQIEELFQQARNDLSRAPQLVAELNQWGVFAEYQDRFFALFKG